MGRLWLIGGSLRFFFTSELLCASPYPLFCGKRYSGGGSYIKTTTTTVVYGKALPTSPHHFTSSPSVFSSRAQTLHRSSLPPLFKLRRPAVNGCEEAPP
ncbi:hypothetical protein F2Q70_00035416 [Brassica cretica]|uniref:Secreted protein n=1 Tax=Brassica cretica TaxID=69181 RepID=A0A8S9JRG1_BRACR|nr:hypothetical protein F2Q70_00035416 [Brassica cretica]